MIRCYKCNISKKIFALEFCEKCYKSMLIEAFLKIAEVERSKIISAKT